MSWHRWLLAVLMTVAIGVPLLFASSDSHAGNDEVKLVVLVASGWNSTGAGAQSDWIYVSKAIRDAAGSDTDVVVQPFSYVSGTSVYHADATNQSIGTSAVLMMAQANRLMSLYPNARLMIVGHSLGGVVASYWLGSLVPGLPASTGSNDRLRDATVVTLDSPVEGLGMLSVADGEVHHLVSNFIRGVNPDNRGNGSKIPEDLNSADIVNYFSGPLAEIRKAANNPHYHNGASIEDLAILASTATLSGADTKFFHSGPGPVCAAQAYLSYLKARLSLEGVSKLLTDPLYADKVYAGKMFDCWMDSHLAVLRDPAAAKWVAGIAKGLLDRDVVKQPTTSPPKAGTTVVPVPTPDFGGVVLPPSGTLKPTAAPTATPPLPNISVIPNPTPSPIPTTAVPRPTPSPVPTTVQPRPTLVPTPSPVPVTVSIRTDNTDYGIGDTAQVCYSVSRAGHVRITDYGTDGSTKVILDGIDDGRGDCFTGTVTAPAGTERMLLQFFSDGGAELARSEMVFIVRSGSSGGGGSGGGGGAGGASCSRAPSSPTNVHWIAGTTTLTWDVADPGGPGCTLTYEINSGGGPNIYRGSSNRFTFGAGACDHLFGVFIGAANQNFGFHFYTLFATPQCASHD